MVQQCLHVIRRNYLIVHRINGYVVVILSIVSNIGAVMIVRRVFGGTLATQAAVDTRAIISTADIDMAY